MFQKNYLNLQSKNPYLKNIAILFHEQTHIERQKKQGLLLWMLRYCLKKTYIIEEEIEAIKSSMNYYQKNNLKFNIETSAAYLSSYLYLWCSNYTDAKRRLEYEWGKISSNVDK